MLKPNGTSLKCKHQLKKIKVTTLGSRINSDGGGGGGPNKWGLEH